MLKKRPLRPQSFSDRHLEQPAAHKQPAANKKPFKDPVAAETWRRWMIDKKGEANGHQRN
jgi:hypothetical protein